jgi:hypothetical protein
LGDAVSASHGSSSGFQFHVSVKGFRAPVVIPSVASFAAWTRPLGWFSDDPNILDGTPAITVWWQSGTQWTAADIGFDADEDFTVSDSPSRASAYTQFGADLCDCQPAQMASGAMAQKPSSSPCPSWGAPIPE